MEKWVVAAKRADFTGIGKMFQIDPVIARIIRNRDVIGDRAINEYLNGGRESLHDPHLLKDADLAAGKILEKIKQKKKIRIIGDYDIDGVNATYILMKGLQRCGADVDAAIPDRVKDGYGLNINLIEKAIADGIDTIVTCDNGISAIEEIAYGKEKNLTILVTDHHEIPYREEADKTRTVLKSNADAIINPKQEECRYPFKQLCGAAVAYKWIQVVYEKAGIPVEEADAFLENAAFATVGDVMDLQGENRVLVKLGLEKLHHTKQIGLKALILKNNLKPEEIKSYHFGFVLGPCINASGRLDTAKQALDLLLCEDEKEAERLAEELYQMNSSRKDLTAEGVDQAVAMIEQNGYDKDKVMVVYLPDCHESIAGIIAGRIRERYNHPVFVLTKSEDGVKGSGRSIPAYSMYEEMVRCRELFTKFGGHPMAAGLSMPEKNVDLFRKRLNENSTLTEKDFIPKIVIDVPMPLEYINFSLISQLNLLEPFGKGNEKPIFAVKGTELVSARVFEKKKKVLKLKIRMKNLGIMEAVYFGDVDEFFRYVEEKFGKREVDALCRGEKNQIALSFVYYPTINEYGGQRSVQIVIQNYC
ncbi:MAG: single-stranded-DNA-specific exonuclease RecJ [Lachnospiraceae bacterium]